MKNGMMKDKTKEMIAAYGFLMPNLIGFLVFTSIPVLASLWLSFVKQKSPLIPKTQIWQRRWNLCPQRKRR